MRDIVVRGDAIINGGRLIAVTADALFASTATVTPRPITVTLYTLK